MIAAERQRLSNEAEAKFEEEMDRAQDEYWNSLDADGQPPGSAERVYNAVKNNKVTDVGE